MVVVSQLVAKITEQGAKPTIKATQAVGSATEQVRGQLRKPLKTDFSGLPSLMDLAAVGVIGVGAAFVTSAKSAMQYNTSMRMVETSNNLTRQEVDGLSDSLLEMSKHVRKGPQDLARGLYYVMGAGFKAGNAMDILSKSAQQASVGMTETEVVANAATAVLKAFPAMDTAKAFDVMTQSVFTGKTEWKDYAPVIGEVAQYAKFAGVTFEEATTALSMLTNTMGSTSQAETALTSLLQTSSAYETLTDRADSLGLTFDKNTYKSLSFIDRLRYLEEATDGNTESMAKLLGQEEALPALMNLLTDESQPFIDALDEISNSTGVADEAFQKMGEGLTEATWQEASAAIERLMIQVGQATEPLADLVVRGIAPLVQGLIDWLEQTGILEKSISGFTSGLRTLKENVSTLNEVVGNFTGEGDALVPVIVGISTALVVALLPSLLATIPAIWSFAAGVIAATWPALAIGAAVAALVAIFLHFYNTNEGFRAFIDGIAQAFKDLWTWLTGGGLMEALGTLGSYFTWLWDALALVGAYLGEVFAPIWEDIVKAIQENVVPAWEELVAAFTPLWEGIQNKLAPVLQFLGDKIHYLIPILQLIGLIVATLVVTAFGILVGIITGLVNAIGWAIPGIALFLAGIIQIFLGAFTFIGGLIMFFVHFFTGQWGKLGNDLLTMWEGIWTMIKGVWNVFSGFIYMVVGFLLGFIKGFVDGVVNFFIWLWNRLVGHSIIPDMINGIIDWFKKLPGRCLAAAQDMASKVLSKLSGLATDALSSGRKIVSNIADGIRNAVSLVTSAIDNVVQSIKDRLPFSPAKVGPLVHLAEQGEEIANQIAKGMGKGLPRMQSAIDNLVQPIAMDVAPSSLNVASTASPTTLHSAHTTQVNVVVTLDGADLTSSIMSRVHSESRKGPIRP
jgi:TP901 family phage tail tape measure protein